MIVSDDFDSAMVHPFHYLRGFSLSILEDWPSWCVAWRAIASPAKRTEETVWAMTVCSVILDGSVTVFVTAVGSKTVGPETLGDSAMTAGSVILDG